MLTKFLLYARTISHFRRDQLWKMVLHRLLPTQNSLPPVQYVGHRNLTTRTHWLYLPAPSVDANEIRFLNVRRRISAAAFDWRAKEEPKLWRYNLHYFDYLHWSSYSGEMKSQLIDSWIAENPVGTEDAWEPYPLSLRIVNWIKFMHSGADAHAFPEKWLQSLVLQSAWQSQNVEHHLLANHLLVNGKALVFAGLFFKGDAAGRLLQQGLEVMLREADEQFLADGGHFERSFQYHSLVLLDYLDVLNLLLANDGLVEDALVSVFSAAAERGLDFLRKVKSADGQIPLFNDSAFGIAPEPDELLSYGERILGKIFPKCVEPLRVCMPDTGYFGYRSGGDSLILDCGPVGPDYQPGHAHCDTLSYELCVDGRRVIVDSGVFDYEPGEMRSYVRGTAAHNTVRIDRVDQSEIWAAFRVARRAYPASSELGDWQSGVLKFLGSHDGYLRLPGNVRHVREVTMDIVGRWSIADSIIGSGRHLAESFVHLHPDVRIDRRTAREFVLYIGETELVLTVGPDTVISESSGWFCPEFGLRQRNTVLVLSKDEPLPFKLEYAIERI